MLKKLVNPIFFFCPAPQNSFISPARKGFVFCLVVANFVFSDTGALPLLSGFGAHQPNKLFICFIHISNENVYIAKLVKRSNRDFVVFVFTKFHFSSKDCERSCPGAKTKQLPTG